MRAYFSAEVGVGQLVLSWELSCPCVDSFESEWDLFCLAERDADVLFKDRHDHCDYCVVVSQIRTRWETLASTSAQRHVCQVVLDSHRHMAVSGSRTLTDGHSCAAP